MRRPGLVVVVCGVAALAGCAAPDETPAGPTAAPATAAAAAASSLPAATATPASLAAPDSPSCAAALPDLSRVSASVQKQIRQRHAALTGSSSSAAAAAALADAYGALGMILMAAKFPDAAETCLLDASALAPDQVRWPYYLGHLHRDGGALQDAATFFEQASRLRPDDLAALVWLGDVRLAQGRPDAAEPLFARALSLHAESLSARFGLGRAALLKEDYRRAAALLEEILARDPGAGAAHYPLGMAYRGLGDDARAEAHVRRRENAGLGPADPLMAELDAVLDSPRAHETRGVAALDREDWRAAAEHFRRGLELDPDHPALRHRLGTALYVMGDPAGALAEFERVARTAPNYPAAHYSIGVLLQAAGRHAEAVERLSTALRYRPSDGEARLRLAISLRRSGDPEAALAHYRSVLRMNPDVIDARFGAAIALVQLQRYREARDRLVAAMDAFPGESIFPHALARLLAAAPDDGIRNGRRALVLVERLVQEEQTIDMGETMAMTLAELGRYDEAAAVQRQLISASEAEGLTDVTRRLGANLRRYERSEPCRTPWPADAMP